MTDGQRRHLRKRFARERDEEGCCDCPGCDSCKGFVRGCTCDHDLSWLQSRNGTNKEDAGEGPTPKPNNDQEFPF